MINLPTGDFDVEGDTPYVAHDLMHDRRYQWQGGRNFVSLDPAGTQLHIFRIEKVSKDEASEDVAEEEA